MPLADRKSTRLNSSHTVIYTLSLHDALPISHSSLSFLRGLECPAGRTHRIVAAIYVKDFARDAAGRSEEHTSELQSHSDLHSFPTRRSSDLSLKPFLPSRPRVPGRANPSHCSRNLREGFRP